MADICQVCKHHKNRPSFCKKKDKFVNRKAVQECCEPVPAKQERRDS